MLEPELRALLEKVAFMIESKRKADNLPDGSEDRRWAFTDYVNAEAQVLRSDPELIRAALREPQHGR